MDNNTGLTKSLRALARVICRALRVFFPYGIHLFCVGAVLFLMLVSWWDFIPTYLASGVRGLLSINCYQKINGALNSTSEIDKVASTAATTVMTLLPALLTFAPFPTARISSLMAFSTGAAILTSAMTLGLSTSKISTLAKDRVVKVKDLCTEATIHFYGNNISPGQPRDLSNSFDRETSHSESISTIYPCRGATTLSATPEPAAEKSPQRVHTKSTRHGQTMSRLYQLYLPDRTLPEHDPDLVSGVEFPTSQLNPVDEIPNNLRNLMLKVLHQEERCIRLHLSAMKLEFLLLQNGILYLLIMSAPAIADLQIVWECPGLAQNTVAWWMVTMALSTGVVRTLPEFSFITGHEILHLSPLPPSLRFEKCEDCSLAMKPAPRRRSALCFLTMWYFQSLRAAFQLSTLRGYTGHKHLTDSEQRSKLIRELPRLFKQISTTLPLFGLVFKSQKSRHAMVVVLRPSKEECSASGRLPLFDIICGYFQALMLIFLTFLFGSTYGGDIIHTGLFVVVFITFVVTSRTYGIYFCWWMEKYLGVTVIEYHTPTELEAIRTILAGMPGVLVQSVTDGYKYSAGYRLDRENDCTNHNLHLTKVAPRAIGRLVGYIVGPAISTGLPVLYCAVPFFSKSNLLRTWPTISFVSMAIFIGFFLSNKIISDFDHVDTHDLRRENDNPPEPRWISVQHQDSGFEG